MVAPAVDLTAVIAGLANLYTGPGSEPLPANTVPLNTVWGGNWVYSGATDSGIALAVTKNSNDLMIEEQSNPALVTVNTTDISISVTLSEDTVENMKIVYGGGTLTTNAGATPPNKVLTLTDTITNIAVGFEGINKFGKARRIYIPTAVAVAQATTSYRRAAEKRMYAVTFRAICAPSSVQVVEVTG